MLTELRVKNIALIGEAEVAFGPGLNILTGETGAGKSILLGSINLALGQKMSKDVLRTGADSALVELVFSVEKEETKKRLAELDIETEDDLLVITRKIQDGKSVSRINGETQTLAKLREVSSLLLDIHGQHEHQSLLYPERQLAIIDAYGKEKTEACKKETAAAYESWRGIRKELDGFVTDPAARERELSLLEYEIKEIDEAALRDGEDDEIESAYRRMANARKIADALDAAHELTGGSEGAGEQVGRALRALHAAAEYDEELAGLISALTDVESLLADFNRDAAAHLDGLSFSDEDFFATEKRLDLLNHLKSKYGKTIGEVLAYREAQQEKLEGLLNFEEKKKALEKDLAAAEEKLLAACGKLTKARKKSADDFSKKVREGLLDLNFLAADFEIAFSETETFRRDGRDAVEFRISTNPGEPVKALGHVASGGELSRVMLAVKTLMADRDDTETLIFDEIDAGISGRTASAVSEKLATISSGRQVICITHLAQIAAQADRHFEIAKAVEGGGKAGDASTATHIRALTEEESIRELARILGGAEVTEAALENARELRAAAKKK